MDQSNLITASTYINNLLLARGLLRSGTPIDFASLAKPRRREAKKERNADAESEETMPAKGSRGQDPSVVAAQVMNLVHDMILRRDRDQSQQEQLAQNLRTFRSDAETNSITLGRLRTKNEQLQRQLALQESEQRSTHAAADSAEATARILREEVARTKTLLTQVRTHCANDLRKRDVEISRLKSHLSERQRGAQRPGINSAAVGASMTIVPGSSGQGSGSRRDHFDARAPSLEDAEYSLKQETNEFLTQLSSNLSDENDELIRLVRGTLRTLLEVQGLAFGQEAGTASLAVAGHESASFPSSIQVIQSSYNELSADLEQALHGLRELLTNPSFAPIEEVEVREEEIQRLRSGWEKMECRWRETVTMMQGWRTRMLQGGDTVNLEELKTGLGLGQGLDALLGTTAISSPPLGNDMETQEDGSFQHDEDYADTDEELALPEEESWIGDDEQVDSPLIRPSTVLQDRSANGVSPNSKAKTGVGKENDSRLARGTQRDTISTKHVGPMNEPVEKRVAKSVSPTSRAPKGAAPTDSKRPRVVQTLPRPKTNVVESSARTTLTRSSPVTAPKLTVEQKLALAAEEARRVSLSASPVLADKKSASPSGSADIDETKRESEDHKASHTAGKPKKAITGLTRPSPSKKTRIAGRPRRRKSTLSPDELEVLMGMRRSAAKEDVDDV